LLLSAVVTMWGLNVVMVKYLTFFPPLLISAIRMSVAALALLPVVLWNIKRIRLSRSDWLLVGLVGLTSVTMHQVLLSIGVQQTTAGTTSLILGLNPLATALLAVPLLGEPLTKRKGIGITLGFSGVLLVVATQSRIHFSGWGDLLIFGSMLMYVIGGLFVRKATSKGIPPLLITAYSQVIASIMLWLLAVTVYPFEVFAAVDTRPFTWLVIFTSGVLATALGSLGWNFGIGRLGAGRTAIFLNGMPLASLIFAALLLGESLQPIHALALLLIVLGVYLGSQAREKNIMLTASEKVNSVKM
jgi:drug/metabolite transporter (DMT)-like permease